MTQSEHILEDKLVKQLVELGYTFVKINNEADLITNLKTQLEKHNNITLSKKEFEQVVNHLNKGTIFDRAKILRDRMNIKRENGETVYIEFLKQDQWCQNQFQVTQQVEMEGTYLNRYDVTLLVNGLPLVQIELKRRGLELKEAYKQIQRYKKHSYGSNKALFNYIQLFVISNGVNTKYYAHNKGYDFKQTFYWTDENNTSIRPLEDFTKVFLDRCHVSKMIAKYIVLNETAKILMVLRPYQFYATERVIDRVKNSNKNAYIWHTTGSGKTLTSFKTSQILTDMPEVHKVLFVVDRKDLDYQTSKEFNSFSKGSVDATSNTSKLVEKFTNDTKLIVTTIQKLNTAISKERYLSSMGALKDKRIVFIFDECHRSQFGDTHKRIKSFFNNCQMFGFTGTPIFVDNASRNDHGKRTTKDLFEECLHKYVITDAIKDENVLKFSIEYVGKYKYKEGSKNEIDIQVEEINTKELMESDKRLSKITDYIIANHDRKTHSKEFTAMFCVSSVDSLIKYYEFFKARKEESKHHLNIATIFSYSANPDPTDGSGFIPDDMNIDKTAKINPHYREKLDEFIDDYNTMFNTNYSTKDSKTFYNYYNNISTRVKNKEIDILLVVNMFLTGFDSKSLNTIYVDKNLKYHGLIQAYSRTNRIMGEKKSQGNIVSFRNLKKATDDAILLFSNKDAKEIIIMEPYEDYVTQFNTAVGTLMGITPTIKSIDSLVDENAELEFIKAFRELIRLKNVLIAFADFSWVDLMMSEQTFEDYKSKYLDLFDKVKSNNAKEKVSILNDVDFELELIHRDEINVAYILSLIAKMKTMSDDDRYKQSKVITDLLGGEAKLRSKKELIEKFIQSTLPKLDESIDINEEFNTFWTREQQIAFNTLCEVENLESTEVEKIIQQHLFDQKVPLRDDIVSSLKIKPKLLERKTIAERVTDKIMNFIETFMNGLGQ